jgi:hypothetical protein
VIARGKELLEVSLELTDGSGRTRDMGGDSPNVSDCVTVRFVPRMAGFEMIKDFFGEAAASARFARHLEMDPRSVVRRHGV